MNPRNLRLAASLVLSSLALEAAEPFRTPARVPVELAFTAQRAYADPFNEVTLDVQFTAPDGTVRQVPAFWTGGTGWKVRYAAPEPGTHRWRSVSSDTLDTGLHGVEGTVQVTPYDGQNPLFRHGPIRVAPDRRHFAHADGTPFFWLGDTWWMGLCARLRWPDEFQRLAAERRAQGFTVIQIVAGLYPDMPAFDERGANEAGFPWERDYARIRPEYFDAADRRLFHMVEQGLVPCVVGAWGYHLPWLGEAKMKQHWRYLIARWGALPVVWCAAGEGTMPYYLSTNRKVDAERQQRGWTEVIQSLRDTDPFDRLVTIHPSHTARASVTNPAVLDFDMQQTGHGSPAPQHAALGLEGWNTQPTMPVISGESRYEALEIGRTLDAADARQAFWMHLVASGVAGGTYGANGLWQVNRREQPYGKSPGGNNWGTTPWDDALRLPGGAQVALARRFFESIPWARLEPMPDAMAWAEAPPVVEFGHWMWFPEGDPREDAPVAARCFRRTFDLPRDRTARRATLQVAADDRFRAWLNGRELGAGSGWSAPVGLDATHGLQAGTNLLAIRAENVQAPVAKNPAALNVVLEVEWTDGTRTALRGATGWRASREEPADWTTLGFDDSTWPAARAVAAFGDAPWGRISGEDPRLTLMGCGHGDDLRVGYMLATRAIVVRGLRPNAVYRVSRFDPVTGQHESAGEATADGQGTWRCPPPAHGHDWVVLLSR